MNACLELCRQSMQDFEWSNYSGVFAMFGDSWRKFKKTV